MNSPKLFQRALITGISGSGGSYLAEYLLDHQPQVKVYGISRWHSTSHSKNLDRCAGRAEIHECDLNDFSSILKVLNEVRPDVIFHIASHANVRASFTTPLAVLQNNVMGTANLLEAIHSCNFEPVIQLCSTSEVYGQVDPKWVPIDEQTAFSPSSPYAVSKVSQDLLGLVYFRSYQMPVIRTRMFTYLNPKRMDLFATAFALQVARIECGLQKELRHGNLESVRTIIDVRDAMEAYWMAAVYGTAGEVYNIGGTKTLTVGEFLEILKSKAKTKIPCVPGPELFRPADVTLQIPNTKKFEAATGWKPKYTFEQSVEFLLSYCRCVVQSEALLSPVLPPPSENISLAA